MTRVEAGPNPIPESAERRTLPGRPRSERGERDRSAREPAGPSPGASAEVHRKEDQRSEESERGGARSERGTEFERQLRRSRAGAEAPGDRPAERAAEEPEPPEQPPAAPAGAALAGAPIAAQAAGSSAGQKDRPAPTPRAASALTPRAASAPIPAAPQALAADPAGLAGEEAPEAARGELRAAVAPRAVPESAQPAAVTEAPRGDPRESQRSAESTERPAPRWSDSPEAERAQQVLRQVRVQLHPGLRAAEIRLEPEELGRISIRITLEQKRLRAVVRAERPETLEVLQRHLPELRAALAQQGLEPQEFDLALDLAWRQASGGDGRSAAENDHARHGSRDEGDDARGIAVALDRERLALALGNENGVDIYA